jgi:hypothetical protein
MIEIREHSTVKDEYELFLDGLPVEDSSIIGIRKPPRNLIVRLEEYDVSKKVALHHFFEIPSSIDSLILLYSFDWSDLSVNIEIRRNTDNANYNISITFIGLVTWKGTFSYADYIDELKKLVETKQNPNIVMKRLNEKSRFPEAVFFLDILPEKQIANEIERCSNILSEFHTEVKNIFAARLSSNSVAISFDFPEEIRVPCMDR